VLTSLQSSAGRIRGDAQDEPLDTEGGRNPVLIYADVRELFDAAPKDWGGISIGDLGDR
jgi:hypothetical protein